MTRAPIGEQRPEGCAGRPAVARAMWVAACAAMICGTSSGCVHSRTVAAPPSSELSAVDVDTSGVPFAPAPEGLLRPGGIEAIQARLTEGGFIQAGQRSGRLDPPTREALRRFQAKNDLPATGLPSYRTIESLKLAEDKIFFSSHRPPAPSPPRSTDQGSVGARGAPPPAAHP